ncbi:DeoR/GlpR family DNA-binding transcription regulator [Litchfieldia alkalitelluris]|uniref:DeoR/GlpR family DNA-binding transcription regulator n=1 Tax=Litchfieldia alkalitelluris TaxID=304268 RepID=UPI0009979F66|nr:DeoR/GlpR family DNA-binding transcription regulator [Litchfieldia alkalitelluris]
MAELLNTRQHQIVDLLHTEGEVKISELKHKFSVTEMTIRRDLEKLELAGLAKRTFGGAIPIGRDVALFERTGYMSEEKMLIGKRAVELVQPGESIFLDGGTTTHHVARYLKSELNITVVTNAINIGTELIGKNIPTIITGGTLLEATSSLVGPITAETLSGMAFDRIFLGATGVNHLHGFSNSNMYEAEIKKIAIKKASEVNIVMDHTKFGAKELFSFAPLSYVHRIVTDSMPDEVLRRSCIEAGVEIEVVEFPFGNE